NSATISAGSEIGRRAWCPVPSYKPSKPAHWQERNYKSSVFIARRAHTWEGGGDRKGWHCVDSGRGGRK
ncbi:hypothetical protein ATANTOWER_031599, partial [Ataeniobius toweri]|nr:hypothetical protein [Ataeniobius toweri]